MERREPSKAKQPPRKKKPAEDECLDDALENTFPASDPPTMTRPHGPRKSEPPRQPS